MQLLQGQDDLRGVEFCSRLWGWVLVLAEFVFYGEQVEELAARAVLEHEVELLLVLETPVQLDQERMIYFC